MSSIKAKTLNRHSGTVWRLLHSIGKVIKEFLRSTVLNGWKYLTFKYLTLWERLFFLCCLIAALYYSFHFALTIVEKWKTSPVITTMNPKITTIASQPFPAITVCNMNQVQHNKVKDFDQNSLNYAMLKKACMQNLNFTAYVHLKQRSDDDNLSNFFLKNAQNCSSMIAVCYYGSRETTCSDFFREILLDEGLCCAFNMVHPFLLYKGDYRLVRDYTSIDGPLIPLDWNSRKGYPINPPPNFYPRPPFGDGKTAGITFILNGDFDNYYCSSTNGPGFKVSVHNPIDTPSAYEIGLSVHLGMETSFRLSPYKEETDESLRALTTAKERQCYFSDEYSLVYYRYYTRRNCETECVAKFILRKCDCLPFHMPLVSKNATECHVRHFNCVAEAEVDFVEEKTMACKKKCLPSCTELSVLAKPFVTALSNKGFQIKNPFFRNMTTENLQNFAIVNLYFPENYYRGYIRTPYMSFAEFASQVGGIMSLMMGFSVISIVEFAYFFALKPLIETWRACLDRNKVAVTKIGKRDNFQVRRQLSQYPEYFSKDRS